MSRLLIALLLLLPLPALWAAEPAFDRSEVEHRFGTDPNRHFLPKTAIDTDEVPNLVIPADQKPTDPLPVYRIGPDTWMFYGNIAEVDEVNRGSNGNAGFVITDEGVVVIDSLGSPLLGQRLIATIRQKTDKPIRFLIVTHNHPDHAYGAIAFKRIGATVIGHAGTRHYIESDRIEHSVAYRRTFIARDMEGFEPVLPHVLVDGPRFSKVTLHLGGRDFDIYNVGQHHSYGDLVVHQVQDGIVWIGDLAFNNRVTFMADGHSKQALEGQEWLLEHFKDAKLMVPGHGSAQTPPFPMVQKTHDYIVRLRKAMAKAIEDDVDLQDAIEQNDFPDWQHVRLYDLNHGKNLDFVYRELEQELF